MNVFHVADALVSHIKANYPDDIAVIAYYGSYAQGTATRRSDLDFFFIPSTNKGYQASIQFIINDISFDFWPISWERAERMASFEDSKTTIIADSKLLYTRSIEDQERFMKLRDTLSALQAPTNISMFVEQSESELKDVYVHLYKLNRAGASEDLTSCQIEAHGVLTKVLQSLALLNRSYFTKGFGKNNDQIAHFPIKPARLEMYMHTIMNSSKPKDILQACDQLTADTLELIIAQKEKCSDASSYKERMKGFYEEIKGTLDKIITACEMNDYETAFFSAIQAQDEIAYFLYFAEKGFWPGAFMTSSAYHVMYKQAGLPLLVPLLQSDDLSNLQAATERLNSQMESYLIGKGVEINRFQTIHEFEEFLRE
jgi:predicted nucleotidyltransferase